MAATGLFRRFTGRLVRPWGKFGRFCAGVALLVALYAGWTCITRYAVFTDDAYVRSDLVAVAPQVTGHIVAVLVADNQAVRQGDVLVKIDPVPFRIAVTAAQAALVQAQATGQADQDALASAADGIKGAAALLQEAQETQARTAALNRQGFASRQNFDVNRAALATAAANLAARRAAYARAQATAAAQAAAIAGAQAALDNAAWQLARTVLHAPVDGIINNLNLQAGDTAQADTPLIGIVAAQAWRVVANYPQSDLRFLRPGGTAWVWLDADPWHVYKARIRGIGRGIARQEGDTGLLPYVAPTTDWIRLQHRFPVTIDLTGLPAAVTLYMGEDASCVVFP